MRVPHNLLRIVNLTIVLCLTFMVFSLSGCRKTYTPRPRSYFRIDLPEKKYVPYHSEECDYNFEVPVYAKVVPFRGSNPEPCWINITFPGFKSTVYITYKKLNNNLGTCVEDIRTLAYKHIIKADDIIENPFSFPDRKVYGMVYDIRGNTASSLSFFATDSTDNFLSGALYFNGIPNKDSLAPMIKFFTADIEHLISTLHWN